MGPDENSLEILAHSGKLASLVRHRLLIWVEPLAAAQSAAPWSSLLRPWIFEDPIADHRSESPQVLSQDYFGNLAALGEWTGWRSKCSTSRTRTDCEMDCPDQTPGRDRRPGLVHLDSLYDAVTGPGCLVLEEHGPHLRLMAAASDLSACLALMVFSREHPHPIRFFLAWGRSQTSCSRQMVVAQIPPLQHQSRHSHFA
jgi:hypothetical protein